MGAQWKQKGREAAANAKGRILSKLAKDIMVAARHGADPASNARLRMALDAARKASMTRDTLERAIKKGAGLLDGPVQYDNLYYRYPQERQIPVYNDRWYNPYVMPHPYHMGHAFILDVF